MNANNLAERGVVQIADVVLFANAIDSVTELFLVQLLVTELDEIGVRGLPAAGGACPEPSHGPWRRFATLVLSEGRLRVERDGRVSSRVVAVWAGQLMVELFEKLHSEV